ncbi:MAG: glutamate--cysteine ligase [Acidobacteriota bacterium]
MSTDLERDPVTARQPVARVEDLRTWFADGCKPRSRWGIGLEYERLGVFRDSGEAIPYAGPHSVSALLEDLAGQGWQAYREDGHPIALSRDATFITLEPGGQTEFSSRIHHDLSELRDDLCQFLTDLNAISAPHDISWLGLGLQPFSTRDDIPWVPKKRYELMSAHLATTGRLGHDMMKRTAGIQVNFDYRSEEDAAAKFRALMGVSPLITALFANSPLAEGRPTGKMSSRAAIWQDTDPARCGLLRLAFTDAPFFDAYLDYALDVPAMFVVRQGQWHAVGIPFRRFIEDGHAGLTATRRDWEMHLTTLFPDVRMKKFLEARCADSAGAGLAMAQVAMLCGIVYDDTATARTWDLVRDLTFDERQALHREVANDGLAARLRGRPILDLAGELVDIARAGLTRSHPDSDREVAFLTPLVKILREGRSPARLLLEHWETDLDHDPARLVEHLSKLNLRCYET